MKVELWVGGVPVPQGSKKIRVLPNGTPILIDDNPHALKAWRAQIRAVAELEFLLHRRWETEAIAVELGFVIPRPASVRREFPSVRPDLDKLVRAVLDSLTGVAFKDDGQVVSLSATKIYRPTGPGVRIAAGPMRDTLDLPELEDV